MVDLELLLSAALKISQDQTTLAQFVDLNICGKLSIKCYIASNQTHLEITLTKTMIITSKRLKINGINGFQTKNHSMIVAI